MLVSPGPVWRHLQFPKLNNICHLSDHLTHLSMSSCNFLSPISLVFLNSLVSSAHFLIVSVTPSSKSLTYTNNKIGRSTDPCSTPLKNDIQLETSPSTTTLCLQSVGECSIQLIIRFPIPCDFNLSIRFWCGTFSGNPKRSHLPMTHHQPT